MQYTSKRQNPTILSDVYQTPPKRPKRQRLVVDNNCKKCLDNARKKINDDIQMINNANQYNYINIDDILDNSDIDSLFKIINTEKFYLILTSLISSYEYNNILNSIFNINIHPKRKDIYPNYKFTEYFNIIYFLNKDLEYHLNNFPLTDMRKIYDIFGSNNNLNVEYDIDKAFYINNDYLYWYFTNNDLVYHNDHKNINVVQFRALLYLLNDLMIELDGKYETNEFKCNDEYDIIRTIDDIDYYCEIHRGKFRQQQQIYKKNKTKKSKVLDVYVNSYFSSRSVNNTNKYLYIVPNKNKIICSDIQYSFLSTIKDKNDNEKMDIFLYLVNIFYNFFNGYMDYILNNKLIIDQSNYFIRDTYTKKMRSMFNNDDYNYDIQYLNNIIRNIENSDINIKNNSKNFKKYINNLFNIHKNDYIYNNLQDNVYSSTKIMFIVKKKIYDRNNNKYYDVIQDSNSIINMFRNEHITYKMFQERANSLGIFFKYSKMWDYFYDYNNTDYYDPQLPKPDNSMDIYDIFTNNIEYNVKPFNKFTSLLDYYILIHFMIFNINLKNNSSRYYEIVKKYFNSETNNDIEQILEDGNNITNPNSNLNNRKIYDIYNRDHITLIIELDDTFIFFDTNIETPPYLEKYLESIFANRKFKRLSLELNSIAYNIQNSEIYSDSCQIMIKSPLYEGKRKGFCASWSSFFKFIYIMNYKNINNYNDLVNLLRSISLTSNVVDSNTRLNNHYKLLKSMLIQLFILYKENIVENNTLLKFKKHDNQNDVDYMNIMNDYFNIIENNIKNNDKYIILKEYLNL